MVNLLPFLLSMKPRLDHSTQLYCFGSAAVLAICENTVLLPFYPVCPSYMNIDLNIVGDISFFKPSVTQNFKSDETIHTITVVVYLGSNKIGNKYVFM